MGQHMISQNLAGLTRLAQWFVWCLEWDPSKNKYNKWPCPPTGYTLGSHGEPVRISGADRSNWMTYEAAQRVIAKLPRSTQRTYALGFWLTRDNGYWFLDIDNCVRSDGTVDSFAASCLNCFPGAFMEYSSSRRGIHIIGRGPIPQHRNKPKKEIKDALRPVELEFYSADRGIAFGLDGVAQGNADLQFNVEPLCSAYFPPREEHEPGDGPRAKWRGPADDDVLIERMLGARHSAAVAFGGKASVAQLWRGEVPHDSEADMALASHLAFWTGCDEARMYRLMLRSALKRDKWFERRPGGNWLQYTIANACATCQRVYQERSPKTTVLAPLGKPPAVRNAADLTRQTFKPIQWALQDLLPEGVTILSSDPKLGKSWMVYGWCIAIATGNPIWIGRPAERRGDALLLALEDNDRRMKRRLDKLLPSFGYPDVSRLYYACEWPRGAEGVAAIREFLTKHPETRIVVIDTIAAFRNADPGRKNAYTWDYEVGALLKPLSQEFQCAFVLVSHNRKAGNGEAHVNQEVSGTTGLVGGVDNVFVLKRSTGNVTAVLHTDGRDIEQQLELALQLADGRWGYVGDARDVNRTRQRSSVLEALERIGGVGTARDIHEAMGATEKLGTLRVRLSRMLSTGELNLSGRLYSRPDPALLHGLTPPPQPGATPLAPK